MQSHRYLPRLGAEAARSQTSERDARTVGGWGDGPQLSARRGVETEAEPPSIVGGRR